MFERFTRDAQAVVATAYEEASRARPPPDRDRSTCCSA